MSIADEVAANTAASEKLATDFAGLKTAFGILKSAVETFLASNPGTSPGLEAALKASTESITATDAEVVAEQAEVEGVTAEVPADVPPAG